jgi:hypothetical protein
MTFASFWMAGYESACHINRFGQRLDLVAATQHDRAVREDYLRLREFGIATVREGLRWPFIERRPGHYDFATLLPAIRAARDLGVQVNWNLCHYGWPDDLDVFAPAFVDRFAAFTTAVARVVRDESPDVPLYTTINEPSFLAWAAGEQGGFIHPHASGRGGELKRQLVRASIAAIEAVRAVDARARFVHVDPLIHVVPRRDRPQDREAADRYAASQYEAADLLCGRIEPGLGGHPSYLDLVGFNYYHSNQWELEGSRLRWEDTPRDDRWVPLHELLRQAWRRYDRPVLLGETSHFGVGRGPWIAEIADEVCRAIEIGIPFVGVCLYPIIDRPDWEDAEHWHNSGLWDLPRQPDGRLARVLNEPYARALREAQARVAAVRDRRAGSAGQGVGSVPREQGVSPVDP